MRITAADFWKLLPLALARLDEHYRVTGNRLPLNLQCHADDPLGNRLQGAERRWLIQSQQPGRYAVDPLSAVIWLLTGQYSGPFVVCRDIQRIGLDGRFANRLIHAIYQRSGFSRPVRKKLLEACNLDVKRYLEPTTL